MTTSSQALALTDSDDDRTTLFDSEASSADVVWLDDRRPAGVDELLGESPGLSIPSAAPDDVEFMEDQPTVAWEGAKVIDIREQLRAAKRNAGTDQRRDERRAKPPETAVVVSKPPAEAPRSRSGWRWVKGLALLCVLIGGVVGGVALTDELTADRVQLPAADAPAAADSAHPPFWSERPVDRAMHELGLN